MKKMIALMVMGLMILSVLPFALSQVDDSGRRNRGGDSLDDNIGGVDVSGRNRIGDSLDDNIGGVDVSGRNRIGDSLDDNGFDDSGRRNRGGDSLDDNGFDDSGRNRIGDSLDDNGFDDSGRNRIISGNVNIGSASGLTSDQAIVQAQRLASGTAERAELELDDSGRVVWKVRLNNNGLRTDVRLDAATGMMTRLRSDDGRDIRLDGSGGSSVSSSSSINAIESARRQSRGELENIELETDDGRLVWNVRLNDNGQRNDVRIDATTGQVVRGNDVAVLNLAGNDNAPQNRGIFQRIMSFFGFN